jgi:preprotein translocase SecE subunit
MKLFDYIKETKAEMQHVTWPKTNVAFGYTFLIVVICILMALFLGFFDYLFGLLIQRVI